MAREKLRQGSQSAFSDQNFYLALTLVVMIVIILVTGELATAVLLIGLIANYFIISSQLVLLRAWREAEKQQTSSLDSSEIGQGLATSVMVNPAGLAGFGARTAEPFTSTTTAPPGAGPPAFPRVPASAAVAGDYPGAIDFGKTGAAVAGDRALALGHVDWDAAAKDSVAEGNPLDLDRVANPQAAAPCVDDDAIAIYDGDELLAYQARSRNDPERVWAGIYRRKGLVDRYVREELDETEDTQWWGRHEI